MPAAASAAIMASVTTIVDLVVMMFSECFKEAGVRPRRSVCAGANLQTSSEKRTRRRIHARDFAGQERRISSGQQPRGGKNLNKRSAETRHTQDMRSAAGNSVRA
jgi:hypothetical protein